MSEASLITMRHHCGCMAGYSASGSSASFATTCVGIPSRVYPTISTSNGASKRRQKRHFPTGFPRFAKTTFYPVVLPQTTSVEPCPHILHALLSESLRACQALRCTRHQRHTQRNQLLLWFCSSPLSFRWANFRIRCDL